MSGVIPFELLLQYGKIGFYLAGKQSLGVDEVDFAYDCQARQYVVGVGAQVVGYRHEYACYLATLFHLQLAYSVVGLHDFSRFDVYRLA